MRKILFLLAVVIVFALGTTAYSAIGDCPIGSGPVGDVCPYQNVPSGGNQGWSYCPNCGQYLGQGGYGMMGRGGMMGPGMMGGGYGMGQGMMGGGYGMGPGMMRGGMGPGMMGPGYYGQRTDCQKFFDDTSDLRKDFNNKKFEYMETMRNPKATPESVTELQNELNKIYGEIQSKAPQGCWAQ